MQLVIGSYTHPIGGIAAEGEGIYRCTCDAESGELSPPQLAIKALNPSYLALHPKGDVIYAVHEVFAGDRPRVSAYALAADAALTPLNDQPVQGELPCHVGCDPQGNWLITAQYWSGDVAVYPLASNGAIKECAAHIPYQGHGPHATRQEGPHAHQITFSPDGERFYVTDLGTDKVMSHALSSQQSLLASCPLPAGSGPRHMALTADGKTAFVANELTETVSILSCHDTHWELETSMAAFACPADIEGGVAAIRLSPDERHLYVSGRRQSAIACLAWNAEARALNKQGEVASGGECPRDFMLSRDGRWVIVANQLSHTLCTLSRNPFTGELTPSGFSCSVNTPVALLELFP